MFKKTAVAALVITSLSGCALMGGPEHVCTPDTRVDIPVAEVELKSTEDQRVIVLPVDMEFDDSAKKKLQSVVRNDLEAQIAGSGAKLVDRKLANKLKNEIKLAEQSGRYNTKGVPIADLAVLTEITASEFSKEYVEASSWVDDDGESHYIPPKCRFEVEVKAVAKIISLPGMELVKRMELEGDERTSTETRSSSCKFTTSQYASLASKAASESVQYNPELKKMLAPSSTVVELRTCEEGPMVKIAMGSDKNVSPGAEIAFSKHMKVDDEIETFGYGEGTVVNIPEHGIKKKYSWVAIDEKVATKVNKGDAVKIMPKACDSLLDLECQTQDLLGL
ncbi:hypothetical protein [Vibrio algarum]|uniref:Uncharacterized protein n=1 Tax=Vibrio algarum TaxID=3020714 RepID=A0ABT4YRL8_9VIBR|nr:hypothetical protein [Vibrio sp. KJ40-1]MDB1124189.1 hypothetical protein [Vibrio sp. KJ40-1]